MNDATSSGPYARTAQIYRAAGWHGVLPIGNAVGKKHPPPSGWTGHDAPMPSAADVAAWQETHGDRNVGLRLPPGVIGLDVDHYGKGGAQKRGGDTLAALEQRFGELPPTWITSARTDGVSGIRLYRVPLELAQPDGTSAPINWPGEAGPNIEIIQTGHRYALAWPSVNPEAGGAVYRWRHDDVKYYGSDEFVPGANGPDIADLPDAWVRGLAVPYARTDKADLNGSALNAWWWKLRQGPSCPLVIDVMDRATAELKASAGARHETARDALRAIVTYGAEGHAATRAAHALEASFEQAVGAERMASGEWQRLLSGAVRLAAAKHDPPRTVCHCPGGTPALTASASLAAMPATPAAPVGEAQPSPLTGSLTLPDEFWTARASLALIRQAAHSRVRSADVVLMGVLARLAALAPHTLKASTLGAKSTPNLFVAVIGPSGGGKSSGLTVSRDLIKSEAADVEEYPLGSGEGISESFMGTVLQGTGEMKKDGSERTERVRKQVRHNVLLHADEGASLNKMIERTGSIVGETLRSAWSGERLGQKNGREETTRTVPGGSYSIGLVIGYQPETVLPLLADVASGTPQRFLYCWAVDETIPPRERRSSWPGEIVNPFPRDVPTDVPATPPPAFAPLLRAPGVSDLVTYAEEIEAELYDRQYSRATDLHSALLADPYQSQHDMLKVKISYLLASLEQRRHVDVEDWRLAQIIIDTSDRVVAYLLARQRDAAARARAASLEFEGEAEYHREHARVAVTAAMTQTAERRVGALIAGWLHETGETMTLGAIRRKVARRDTQLVESALALAEAAGWLVFADGRATPGPSRPSTA